jgi:3alpha(or 20beta)-hydroxysteroid dehydrogenase
MNRLTGKVALVTGAARGIGLATANLFAEEGAMVVASDVANSDAAYHHRVDAARLDVASEEAWREVAAGVERQHGRLDVLVNNAAIATHHGVIDLDLETWNEVIAVTQTGVFLGMRAVIPLMRRGGGGSIINFSSIWGSTAVPGFAAYHAAKGAVRTLSKNAAVTYASDGIRVNSLHPGFVHTPATDGQDPAITRKVLDATPLGRGASPGEIAYACVYLASDESAFVTGSELVIDGGYLAQ